MGESVAEGTVLEWLQEGRRHRRRGRAPLVEISTDKVDAEVPSPVAGTSPRSSSQPDETVAVGHDRVPDQPAGRRRRARRQRRRRHRAAEPEAAAAPRQRRRQRDAGGRAHRERPRHRRASVEGSGPRGRVTKEDVLARRRGQRHAPRPAAPRRRRRRAPKPIRGPAATLARFMDESRSIPTATSFRTLPVDMLDARRKRAQGGRQEALVHPPDRLGDRAGRATTCR